MRSRIRRDHAWDDEPANVFSFPADLDDSRCYAIHTTQEEVK